MLTSSSPSLADAESWVARHFDGRAQDVAEAGRGEWSVAYSFLVDGTAYIVRFGGLRDDFDKDRYAARFASPALPIPRLTEVGETDRGFYAISERAYGDFLEQFDEESLRATLPSLFAAFDSMRTADIGSTSGYGFWDGEGRSASATWEKALLDTTVDTPGARVSGWREKLTASEFAVAFDRAEALHHQLARSMPSARHLIHNDPLNRNILVQQRKISAVIDWGCGMYGDFLYDVAYCAFWSAWYPWRSIDFIDAARRHYAAIGLELPSSEERLLCYQLDVGLGACAYSALKDRWHDVAWILRRFDALLTHA